MSQNFATVKTESDRIGERNDCAVKAVSISTGVPYALTHAAFKRNGRRNRCGTQRHITMNVIDQLGFKVVPVYPQGRTVKTVARELVGGDFLVTVRGHILAVKNGKVEDWTDGRQHRVREVYKVLPKHQEPAPVAPVARPQVRPQPRPVVVTPAAHRGSVAATIFAIADRMWADAGKPTELRTLLNLRKQMMNAMEAQGIKRTTASTTLGQWQKAIIW